MSVYSDDEEVESGITKLASIFDLSPKARLDKSITLFKLARGVSKGMIVELGAFHGCGTIALCLGANAGTSPIVHSVDQYTSSRGWANEPYVEGDMGVFFTNIHLAEVQPVLHVGDFVSISELWTHHIGLLWWDGGVGNMRDEVSAWEKFIIKDGVLAIRDISDGRFGAKEYMEELARTGCYDIESYQQLPGYIHVIMKCRDDNEEAHNCLLCRRTGHQ